MLPEYAEMVNADADTYHEKQARFMQAANAAHDRTFLQQMEGEKQAVQERIEADRFDRYLDETQLGDEINPIPWKERKVIFSEMAKADPRLIDRLPSGSAEDRYLWITAQVNQARPDVYRGHLRNVLLGMRNRTQTKTAAAPIASGQSPPVRPQGATPGTPAQATQSYLDYLKSGRGGQ